MGVTPHSPAVAIAEPSPELGPAPCPGELRLRDCLERAVPLLLEATAQRGSLCHARAWRNTRVCCSGPRAGLVTVATAGLLPLRWPREQDPAVTAATQPASWHR